MTTPLDLARQARAIMDNLIAALVPTVTDLQAAINAANGGDVIAVPPGATFGSIYLPARTDSTKPIVIMNGGTMPPAGVRITPGAGLPRILQGSGGGPALMTQPGAANYILAGFEIAGMGSSDLVTLGDGSAAQNTLASVPHDLTIERCWLHGDPDKGQKRGIALNAANVIVQDCYLSDFKLPGQDAQALGGWNGPGPFAIANNYLEASGENILFGGTDSAIPNLTPADITIAGNTITKPLAWRQQGWSIKNLFELKNAQRVSVINNQFSNCWLAGQSGYAIQITVRNQDGANPGATVQDVTFQGNTVSHIAALLNILALDDTPGRASVRAARLTFRDLVVTDLDESAYGSNGRTIAVQGAIGPDGLVIDDWLVTQSNPHSILDIGMDISGRIGGLVMSNSVFLEGDYGIRSATDSGKITLDTYAPGYSWVSNTVIRGTSGRNISYPAGTILK